MSIELTSGSIGTREDYFDNFVEQSVDCDVSLPDYCPDIMRILRCTIDAEITNSKLTGDRATADGSAKIRVVYADEKNKVFCYEQDYPFSKYAELSAAYDNAVLFTRAKTEYANCRAVSKRRLDIHGVVGLHFSVCGTGSRPVVCDAQGDGIQLKKQGIDVDDIVAMATKRFQLAEVQDVGDNNPGIGRVIDACAFAPVTETRIIKGKALIKGELCVRVTYCSDSGENEACTICCNIPFNEIAEMESITDDCRVNVEIAVSQLTAEPKTDNDGEYRYMNINAELTAMVTAYRSRNIKVITDAYSTDIEIETTYMPMEFMQITNCFSDSFMCKESLDISSLNPQKIFAAICGKPEARCAFEENKMTISGKIPVKLIVIDSDGAPVFCEREANFEYARTTDNGAKDMCCTPLLELSGCSFTLSGDGKAELKAEININAVVFKCRRKRVLTELKASPNPVKKEKKASLTVYFCSGGESVWDIARKYNTTVEEIMQENELSADIPENKTMLLIPIK